VLAESQIAQSHHGRHALEAAHHAGNRFPTVGKELLHSGLDNHGFHLYALILVATLKVNSETKRARKSNRPKSP
jgi:hypothetical protein